MYKTIELRQTDSPGEEPILVDIFDKDKMVYFGRDSNPCGGCEVSHDDLRQWCEQIIQELDRLTVDTNGDK